MKVIFDSDLLGDDFFALYAIAKNKDIDFLAVTSFGRITSSLVRAQMAQVFLETNCRSGVDIIPGASKPLIQESSKGCMHCNEQMVELAKKWSPKKKYHATNLITDICAAEYIVNKLKKDKDIILLCTGPLTNIALAYSIDPSIVDNVKAIYMMGGANLAFGNKSPVAESNIFNDADAASIVFNQFSNIHVVPLDLTLKFNIDENTAMSIHNKFFKSVSLACCWSHRDRGEQSVMPMHDYLTYLAMVDDDLIKYEKCDIKVETKGSKTRGMLIIHPKNDGKHFFGISINKTKCYEYYKKDFQRI